MGVMGEIAEMRESSKLRRSASRPRRTNSFHFLMAREASLTCHA